MDATTAKRCARPAAAVRSTARSVATARASTRWKLLAAPDAEVLRIAGGWYVADRDPRWVRRNALLVVGNSGVVHDEVASVLKRYINGDDALLAEHARWAAGKLGIVSLVCDELVP